MLIKFRSLSPIRKALTILMLCVSGALACLSWIVLLFFGAAFIISIISLSIVIPAFFIGKMGYVYGNAEGNIVNQSKDMLME